MKLLDTRGNNTKVKKSNEQAGSQYRFASMSLMPNNQICAGAKAAGCMDTCLTYTGMAEVYPDTILTARQAKSDLWMHSRDEFLAQLRKELSNFDKLCFKQSVTGVVRLNVYSDIPWEEYGIPQEFPRLQFYDYTKIAARLEKRLPPNYRLMFSYSKRATYAKQVERFVSSGSSAPMAVVFKGEFPKTFMGRTVVDGDASDWLNVNQRNVVVGLKFKGSFDDGEIAVNPDIIAVSYN